MEGSEGKGRARNVIEHGALLPSERNGSPESAEYDDMYPEDVRAGVLGLAGILGLLVVIVVIASVAIALVWLQHR